MNTTQPLRVHLITGGYPPGATAGHDMDYTRRRLLYLLGEDERIVTTTGNDFSDIGKWLAGTQLLITYVAGPHPNEAQDAEIRSWLEAGGRWLGLHGTSGGRAARIEGSGRRRMVKARHHETLGSFFLNHPPVRRFEVAVRETDHPLTRGLPATFEVEDELYILELQGSALLLLTTELPQDPSPEGFGFHYDEDTSLLPDGKTRALGHVRELGAGAVAYVALGHCHSPRTNAQPFVDTSVAADTTTPLTFRGPWESQPFQQLLRNAIHWGVEH